MTILDAVLLRSPDGTVWKVTANNDGTLTLVQIGTVP